MQYRKDKYGNDISALGYGCMRFTKKGNSADLDKAEKEVMAAIEAGGNYFETAYVYSGNEGGGWEKFYTGIIAGRKSTLPQSFRII